MKNLALRILISFEGRRRPWYLTSIATVFGCSTVYNIWAIIRGLKESGLLGTQVGAFMLSFFFATGLWTGRHAAGQALFWWGVIVAVSPWAVQLYRGWTLNMVGVIAVSALGVALIVAASTEATRMFLAE